MRAAATIRKRKNKMNNYERDNLASAVSKDALATKAKLEAEIAAVLEADRVRTPEMTEAETAEIKTLQVRHDKLTIEMAAMYEYMRANETRYADLKLHVYDMYRAGGDPSALVSERDHRLSLAEFMMDSYRQISAEKNNAASRITNITENARARQIQAEREQN
jgi:hypothetical protein